MRGDIRLNSFKTFERIVWQPVSFALVYRQGKIDCLLYVVSHIFVEDSDTLDVSVGSMSLSNVVDDDMGH